jgi:hypothetical protein
MRRPSALWKVLSKAAETSLAKSMPIYPGKRLTFRFAMDFSRIEAATLRGSEYGLDLYFGFLVRRSMWTERLSPAREIVISVSRSISKAGEWGGSASRPATAIRRSAGLISARAATPPGRTSWKAQRRPSFGV